ncbi:MAG: hypothetical protein GY801_05875 [bacterium]|nr:hypothetical protein [bacterium]
MLFTKFMDMPGSKYNVLVVDDAAENIQMGSTSRLPKAARKLSPSLIGKHRI